MIGKMFQVHWEFHPLDKGNNVILEWEDSVKSE